jgi:N-acetylmuramoyl-L-alanine amidase
VANYDVGLFIGHGLGDPGACFGEYKENEIVKKIVMKAKEYIGDKINVHVAENNYLKNYTSSNTYSTRYCLSVHINSGGGYGAEVFVPLGEKFLETETGLLNGLMDLGLKSRGIKSRDYATGKTIIRTSGSSLSGTDYYKEIRDAWNKNSLSILEVGFIDTSDINIIIKKIDEIAFVIARELCKLKGITLKKPATAKPTFRVVVDGKQVGAYSIFDNVIREVEDACSKGAKKVEVQRI